MGKLRLQTSAGGMVRCYTEGHGRESLWRWHLNKNVKEAKKFSTGQKGIPGRENHHLWGRGPGWGADMTVERQRGQRHWRRLSEKLKTVSEV